MANVMLLKMALWMLLSFFALQDHAAVACGGSYQGSLRGNLSTPNYPQNYPDGSKCIWIIHCPYQHVVSVSLPSISIEEDKTCAFDYLVFYDGSSVRAKELSPQGNAAVGSKVCGRQSNLKWKSTGASITAQFHSDDSTSEKGFSGTWSCIAVPVMTTTLKTNGRSASPTTRAPQTHVKKKSTGTARTGAKPSPHSHSISTARPVVTIEGFTVTRNDQTTPSRTTEKPSKVTAIPSTTLKTSLAFCPASILKNMHWKRTASGAISRQHCPAGSSGLASRECHATKSGHAQWSSFVDASDCVSSTLGRIQQDINNPNVPSISSINDLLVKTRDSLMAGDLIKITQQLKDLSAKAVKNDLKNPKKGEIAKLNDGFMNIGDRLLDSSAWNGLSKKRRMKTVADLLKNLEEVALAVIKAQSESPLESKDYINTVTANIVSSSKTLHVNGSGGVNLLSEALKRNATLKNTDWKLLGQVKIPQKTIKDVAGGNTKCYSACIVARNVGKFLTDGQSSQGKKTADSGLAFVNTFVTSLAISPKPSRPFPEPVVITGKSLVKLDPKKSDSKCSYWNSNSSSWSQNGLETISVKADETICRTNHFTNFAVLMRTNDANFSARHGFILMIITQVGIGVSLLCLILALSIFINCKSLHSVRNTIHKNLCVSLALAYVVFVVGISRTENRIVCTVFSTLLYYFLLVAFMWMLMEGVQLYILIVQIFPRGDGFKKQYYAICWGAHNHLIVISNIPDKIYKQDGFYVYFMITAMRNKTNTCFCLVIIVCAYEWLVYFLILLLCGCLQLSAVFIKALMSRRFGFRL